ncbi:MAG TPA: sigma-70 family RNA polymerase sigma factor [Frankiaceae bacterium]|nr:sigma-70 family RNA polymerase sigma factor [Frankiaceae bacterium]
MGRSVYIDVTDAAWGAAAGVRRDSFTAFYAETIGPLGGYAYQLVGDRELAADVVQEAYTRLLSRWVGIRKPRPYLFHVVTNLARDAWSARQRGEAIVRGLVDARPEVATAPLDPSVWDAVARLPAVHREVVLLYYYADLPLADVAAAVRRPPGTVKRLLSEARDLLAGALGDE